MLLLPPSGLVGCIKWCEAFSHDKKKLKCPCKYVNLAQFIVGEDGTCGLVYEHSPAEGPPIVFLIDYVVKYM